MDDKQLNSKSGSNPSTTNQSDQNFATSMAAQPTGLDDTIQSADPGHVLGIIGLATTFFIGPIGLALCIVALVKSKKVGSKNIPAIIGIVIGIIQVVMSLLVLAWFMVYVSQVAGDEFKSKMSSDASMKTYTTDQIKFDYPSDWQAEDASNKAIIDGNGVSSHTVTTISFKNLVSGTYAAYDYGTKQAYDISSLRNLMNDSVEEYNTPDGLAAAKATQSTVGFGCAPESNDFTYLSKPHIVNNDKYAGLSYSYSCMGYFGKIKGIYFTSYDTKGDRHTIGVNTIYENSDDRFKEIEQLVDSFSIVN